jgi:predicted tellurium resistance membrane protein TerC
MELLLDPNLWIAFAMLTALEIVLGVDNIIFISILVGRLPPEQRDRARRLGLGFAMVSRLLLLFSLSWVMSLTADLFSVMGNGISGRDIVLLLGGLFLLYKASHEIFVEVEAPEQGGPGQADTAAAKRGMFWGVIGQIAVIDIVFSLDSVITAVGMVDQIGVMVAAVVTSVGVMLVAAKPIGEFVDRHPSVKVLALAFLVMVGMALTAEAFEIHMPKGYIYAAMAFSLGVEALNIRSRAKRRRLEAPAPEPVVQENNLA